MIDINSEAIADLSKASEFDVEVTADRFKTR
jgi:hypothetical protein